MAKNTDLKTPWKRFISMLQLDRRDIKQILFYAIFAGLVSLSLPLGIQAIINLIQGAQISTSWIVLVVLVTLGVAFQGALQLMQIRILENVQQKIFARASFEFAYRFPKIKMKELRNYYPPELANRFFDVLTVQKGLSKILLDFPAAILQIVFGIILLSFYHPFFIIYGLLLLILVLIVFRFTARKGLETSLKESKLKYKVAHWIQEIARSIVSFKISGNTTLAMNRNDDLTALYLKAREGHFRVLIIQFLQMIGFKVLVTAGLLVIGGLLVLNQQMNIGQFVAAEIIILLVISSVEKLILGLETFYDVLTSLEKIGQVVDKEIENQEGVDPFEKEKPLHIELEKLGITTPEGQVILKDINLIINEKERMIIDGPSGSGKTTLLKLISTIESPTEGSIYVNGNCTNGIFLNKYRKRVGQVLPENQTFEGTILENITLNDSSISIDKVNEVIEQLGLLPFVKKNSASLNTLIYSQGKQIPHTIARKIVIARAIVHEPKLLLLKDPLDQFDPVEAKEIITYLSSHDRPWALVVSSKNPLWNTVCSHTVHIENGTIKNNKRDA
ncbi:MULTISPECIES: peptidase domain-containing ABC transporter [Nonlabens]|uniref:peptidase domain-containing ABC transporter n=1 Tax=Nonlabens TaxID=363408 RepID=UPI000CF4082C|nr:ATP-binding cassette domain-containing protein [Nonlabens tegetincola]PQJ19166.1 ABC transporter ATP-binding protein/permease [Nonlabens tegetincola]